MRSIFLLFHSYELNEGEAEVKALGDYATLEQAEARKWQAVEQQGFRDHPTDFVIVEAIVDSGLPVESSFRSVLDHPNKTGCRPPRPRGLFVPHANRASEPEWVFHLCHVFEEDEVADEIVNYESVFSRHELAETHLRMLMHDPEWVEEPGEFQISETSVGFDQWLEGFTTDTWTREIEELDI